MLYTNKKISQSFRRCLYNKIVLLIRDRDYDRSAKTFEFDDERANYFQTFLISCPPFWWSVQIVSFVPNTSRRRVI